MLWRLAIGAGLVVYSLFYSEMQLLNMVTLLMLNICAKGTEG